MNTDTTFITNEERRTLRDRFRVLISEKSNMFGGL